MVASVLDEELRRTILGERRRINDIKAAAHEPSGKLSAGQLSKPLLEQVLKLIGVPGKPKDDYSLGLFARGDQAEDHILELLEPDETQKEASYRGCIGYIDAIKDGRVFEVKSIKNSQVPYLNPETKGAQFQVLADGQRVKIPKFRGPKFPHLLQGGYYAICEEEEFFTIIYVSADDLRVFPFVVATADVQSYVDAVITDVATQLQSGELPPFTPRPDFDGYTYSWQLDPKYSDYPEWINLPPELALDKLQKQFPDSYKKLMAFKGKKK